MRTAIYPGSFDPPTNGHVNIIERSLRLFDRVIVAVAHNVQKTALFSVDERKELIAACVRDGRLEVDAFQGLLVNYARERGAVAVIRGLRAVSDFEYEFQMANMNRKLGSDVEAVFMMTNEENFYISSRLVREVAQFGGDIRGLVPPPVLDALGRKLSSGKLHP
jgi:pantetheine-phosphate adenylyltransferase